MRAHVTVYNQVSVDGQLGGFASHPSLYYRLGFRWRTDAILMGSVTARAFGPTETAAEQAGEGPTVDPMPIVPGFEDLVREPRPLLVVVDSRGTVRNWRHSQAQPWYGGHVSLASSVTPPEHLDHLAARGVDVVQAGGERIDLPRALVLLREQHGVERVRTDSGGALTGALLAAGCVDELVVLVVPTVSADPDATSLVSLPRPVGGHGFDLRLDDVERVDDGHVLLRYSVMRHAHD